MLAWILAVGAAACLIYFITIILYSGIGTSFAIIWLLLGCFLGAAAAFVRYYQKTPERVALWLPVSLVTLCVSGMVIVLVVQVLIFGRIPFAATQNLDYVIVLGAQVKPEAPSKTLRLRMEKAAEYALQNPETILVLSGGQGAGEPTTEAEAMKQYLLAQGIEADRLLLEEHSSNTAENIAYSRKLIEEHQEKKKDWKKDDSARIFSAIQVADKPVEIGIVTSNFHLYRARMIARKQGMENIKGIASESDRVLFIHFCIRDSLAILKDRLLGNL